MSALVSIKNNRGKLFSVASIKGEYIDNIIRAAGACSIIDKVMLFGSALGSGCKKDSDIDIAVIGNQSKSKALKSKEYRRFTGELYDFDYGQQYDILYFTDKEFEKDKVGVKEDIEKGALIYERV